MKPILADLAPITVRDTTALPHSRRWTLAALSLAMLLSSLGTSIANVGLPAMAQAFGASFQQVQWIVLAYLLAVTTLVVGAGRLGDITGRKRLLLVGIAVFTMASVLCSSAPALPWLVAARAAQGLGAAIMMALTMAFVSEAVPKAKTGSAMGLLGTMSAIGTALGPSLGGVLIAVCGWQALFLANVPLGVLAFFLAQRHLPADGMRSDSHRGGFDKTGTLLLALALAAYALAMTLGHGHLDGLNLALLCAAVIATGVFVRVESRARSPLIRLAMFRNRALSTSLAMNALVSTVMMASLVVGPFYLSRALGLAAAPIGFSLAVGPVVSALSGVPAGRITDRFGVQGASLAALGCMFVGASVLALLPTGVGLCGYLAPLAVITVGYALFQAANNTSVMADASAEQRGLLSGLLGLSRNLGLVSGASVMGAVFARASSSSVHALSAAEAAATGMRATFAAAAVLIAAAFALAIALRRKAGANAS